jgi:hypothetical protein
VIDPVGWAGLIFGLPIWTLWASIGLVRRPRTRGAEVAAA